MSETPTNPSEPAPPLATLNTTNLGELADAGEFLTNAIAKLQGVLYDLTSYTPEDVTERSHALNCARTVNTILQGILVNAGYLSRFAGVERDLWAARQRTVMAERVSLLHRQANRLDTGDENESLADMPF